MQGGLIGLAAATVGLASEAAQHLEVRTLLCSSLKIRQLYGFTFVRRMNAVDCINQLSNINLYYHYRVWYSE